jgi:hypothetical protein
VRKWGVTCDTDRTTDESREIDGFKLARRLRQIVAIEHLLGNPGYTLGAAIGSVYKIS